MPDGLENESNANISELKRKRHCLGHYLLNKVTLIVCKRLILLGFGCKKVGSLEQYKKKNKSSA